MNKEEQKAILVIVKNYLGCPVDAQALADAMVLLMGATQDTASPTE
jgi:dTDP-4-dehydrorhamnose reductase